jgi:hypothetical protein
MQVKAGILFSSGTATCRCRGILVWSKASQKGGLEAGVPSVQPGLVDGVHLIVHFAVSPDPLPVPPRSGQQSGDSQAASAGNATPPDGGFDGGLPGHQGTLRRPTLVRTPPQGTGSPYHRNSNRGSKMTRSGSVGAAA